MNNGYHTANTANKINAIRYSQYAKDQLEEKLNANFNSPNHDRFDQCVNWYREFSRRINDFAGDPDISAPQVKVGNEKAVFDMNIIGKAIYRHAFLSQERISMVVIEYFEFNSKPMTYPLVESKHLEENKEIKRIKEIMNNMCH